MHWLEADVVGRAEIQPESVMRSINEAIQSVIEQLDAAETPADKERRSTQRCRYRRTSVAMKVCHPGGTVSQVKVATRDLSVMGAGLICPTFLHVGTRIELTLQCRVGGMDVIHGVVANCNHVTGTLHHVGVKFNAKIFPKLYLDPGTFEETDADGPVNATALSGSVLHVDDQEMDCALLRHYLRDTKVAVTTAQTTSRALELVTAGSFSLVICDLNLLDGTGEELIKGIREKGYKGPICVVSAETSPSRLAAAQKAGAVSVLNKPYDRNRLLATIRALAGGDGSDAIYSTLAPADQDEMVGSYVSMVRKSADDLMTLFDEDSFQKVRKICMNIKGNGNGFGFASLSAAAADTVKNLDATMSVLESQAQLQKLIDLCRRATTRAVEAA
jgi:CheY-like chemotaxis protein